MSSGKRVGEFQIAQFASLPKTFEVATNKIGAAEDEENRDLYYFVATNGQYLGIVFRDDTGAWRLKTPANGTAPAIDVTCASRFYSEKLELR